MGPLRGQYGFLTQFDSMSAEQTRNRVIQMVEYFNIMEFQFYDAFGSYSGPPRTEQEAWVGPLFGRFVRRSVVWTMTDEVRRSGGRSWLYVQAVGADPGDAALELGHTVVGQHIVNDVPLMDIVVPTAAWANAIAPRWAAFAAELGFSGIHWDTLGNVNKAMREQADFPAFLRAALPALRAQGLDMTANFVDGAFWDPLLLAGGTIAFPYWEVWTVPAVQERFFSQVAPQGGGVFVCYPGRSADHTGERQNSEAVGMAPFDLLLERWQLAQAAGNAYLAVGDGTRYLQYEYFPDTASLTDEELAKLRQLTFHAPGATSSTPVGLVSEEALGSFCWLEDHSGFWKHACKGIG